MSSHSNPLHAATACLLRACDPDGQGEAQRKVSSQEVSRDRFDANFRVLDAGAFESEVPRADRDLRRCGSDDGRLYHQRGRLVPRDDHRDSEINALPRL
eukprot:2338746-Pleurochrysis_carterae.AAC.2